MGVSACSTTGRPPKWNRKVGSFTSERGGDASPSCVDVKDGPGPRPREGSREEDVAIKDGETISVSK